MNDDAILKTLAAMGHGQIREAIEHHGDLVHEVNATALARFLEKWPVEQAAYLDYNDNTSLTLLSDSIFDLRNALDNARLSGQRDELISKAADVVNLACMAVSGDRMARTEGEYVPLAESVHP